MKASPRPGAGAPQSPDARAVLVSAAVDALRETGYAGATAREIAGRAGCSELLILAHFGTLNNLLLAALDEVSARRMDAYKKMLEQATSVSALAQAARTVFNSDLDAGYVRVLLEMVTAGHAVPELAGEVARRLAPWREITEDALRRALGRSAAARMLPPEETARALMAGFLGLELMASLDGDREAALQVVDRFKSAGRLLDLLAGLRLPGAGLGRSTEHA